MLDLSLGPFALSIYTAIYGVAFGSAIVVGWFLGRKVGGGAPSILIDSVLIGVMCARVAFVAHYFEQYKVSFLGVLDLRDGGFHPLAGAIGITAFVYWKIFKHKALMKPLLGASAAGALTWGCLTWAHILLRDEAQLLPNVEVVTLNQASVRLSNIANGRPMVVNLWATWCPPCIREMPVLEKAQSTSKNIVFAFVNQGEPAEIVGRFLSHQQLTLENVLIDQAKVVGGIVQSSAFPTTLFYRENGTLAATHLGALSEATLLHKLKLITPSTQ